MSYLSASGVTSLLAICEHALSLLLCVLVLLSLLLLVLVSLLLLALLLLLLLLLVVKCFSLLFVSKWWHVAVRVQIRQHVVSFFSESRCYSKPFSIIAIPAKVIHHQLPAFSWPPYRHCSESDWRAIAMSTAMVKPATWSEMIFDLVAISVA